MLNGKKLKTLFLFIPHFVFSSDLLHTDFIKYLAQKHRVVVFSPIFESNPSSNYYQSPNIQYVKWNTERPNFWLFWTKTLRISMIREFDNLEYMKTRFRRKTNFNWKRELLTTISRFIPKRFVTADFFTKLETWLSPNSRKFRFFLKKYNPCLILTCTPGFSSVEAEAIIMAKKNRIRTAAIDSGWDNFTANAIQMRGTDFIICWNEIMKNELIKLHHYPENKVFISGVYRFDHHFSKHPNELSREEFLKTKNLNPGLKTLFLSTVPPNTYPPQYKVWQEIIRMREEKKFSENVNIFIRLHPNDDIEKYNQFRNLEDLHIELPGKQMEKTSESGHKIEMDEIDLDNLRYSLKYTDININFRSSLSLEATIYDKPIINLALHDYQELYQVDWYIPILQSQGVKLATDQQELLRAVNNYLKNPTLDSLGRKKIFKDYINFSDGLSFKRSAEVIEREFDFP